MTRGRIIVDVERCKGCELCIGVCPKDVIRMAETFNAKGHHPAALVDPNGVCTGCAICAVICPEASITVYRFANARRASLGGHHGKGTD
jgi:2-oxoglutarate ferredoxin oxidoreductase subunit delta